MAADETIVYRRATLADAARISELILSVQETYTFPEFSPEGRALMARFCSEDFINRFIERGDIYYVALLDGEIIGVIGVREHSHVAHNFVVPEHHSKGVSSKLWELARTACLKTGTDGRFTLRSSTKAVPIYERWGFRVTGPKEDSGGIVSTPMVLDTRKRGDE